MTINWKSFLSSLFLSKTHIHYLKCAFLNRTSVGGLMSPLKRWTQHWLCSNTSNNRSDESPTTSTSYWLLLIPKMKESGSTSTWGIYLFQFTWHFYRLTPNYNDAVLHSIMYILVVWMKHWSDLSYYQLTYF